jgi:ubiquitin carboxyl-terminal hydrolase 4/11/15
MADQEQVNTNSQDEAQEETTAEMQRRVLRQLIKEDEAMGLEEGETYYLLNSRWWREWKNAVGYDKYSSATGSFPRAIDNSDLFEDEEKDLLKRNLSENYNFVILSKRAWDQLVEWYGGGPAAARKCIRTGWQRNTILELIPLKVQVIFSRNVKNVLTASFSKASTIGEFVDSMYPLLKFNRKRIRVFDFHAGRKHKLIADWVSYNFCYSLI